MKNRWAFRHQHQRLLIAGFGQVAQVLANHLEGHDFTVTCRSETSRKAIRQNTRSGRLRAVSIDLSKRLDLRRLAPLSRRVIWMAPPNPNLESDQSARDFCLEASRHQNRWNTPPVCVAYVSTTGVYGNAQGLEIDESWPRRAESARAIRRVKAEEQFESGFRGGRIHLKILRAPGIYSEKRLPEDRLRRQDPAILHEEDSYSNHIHELDLGRLCRWLCFKGRPLERVNACDEAPMKMGDYFDLVAGFLNLPKPPRLPRSEVQTRVSPMMWSFMRESRRIRSKHLKRLGFKLKYPSVHDCLTGR